MERKKGRMKLDRISEVPDDVAIHILSFVDDTKLAVQLSVLSKRWVNLWKLLPNLILKRHSFKKIVSFKRFVDKILILRDQFININNFTLITHMREPMYLYQGAIDFALSHNVHNLTLQANSTYKPFDLYYSSTLTMLKLNDVSFPTRPLCFQQLLHLDLHLVALPISDPFSGCPNLKTLIMDSCCYMNNLPLQIFSPHLSALTLRGCLFNTAPYGLCRPNIIILTAPRLNYFKFEKASYLMIQADQLPYVTNVYIDLDIRERDIGDPTESKEILHRLIIMLKRVYAATSVTLSMSAVELLSMFPDKLEAEASPFRNLKSLNILLSPSSMPSKFAPHVQKFLLKNSPCSEIVMESPGTRGVDDE